MRKLLPGAAALVLLAIFSTQPTTAHAQGTAFTYQGRLNNGTNAANGIYDLRFAIYDAATAGTQQGSLLTNAATAISNGLFTVTLDFGNQFPGAARWLEIGVRSNSVGTFQTLNPRQPLTPAPYAVFANTASNVSGSISGSQIFGQVPSSALGGTYSSPVNLSSSGNTFAGDGSGLTGVAKLAGGNAFAGSQTVDGEIKAMGTFGALSFLNRNNQAETWQWNADNSGMSLQNFGGSAGIPWHVAENGQVGIGTTTPANKLDVQGSADFNGSVGIGTSTPKHKLDVNGNLWVGSQLNGQTFTEISDAIYLGGSRKYLGNTLGAPVDGTTDWLHLMAHPLSGGIMFGLSGPSDADPHSAPVPLMVIQSNGKVGIGATNPATALQVNGIVTATGFSGDGSGLTGLSATNISGGKVADALLSTNVALRSGGNIFSGNQSFSGNIGLGTAPSAYKLDLLYNGGSGGMHLATSSGYSALDIDAPSADTVVRFENAGAFKWLLGNSGSSSSFFLYDAAASVNRFWVQGGTGNVGIGTTTPSSALQVNGTVTATTFAGSGSAVDFKVNGQRGFRLEYVNNGFESSVNVIGGYSSNYVASGLIGATIAGGGDYFGSGSNTNAVLSHFGTIGGGYANTVSAGGNSSTVGGGFQNTAGGNAATVPGGDNNVASGNNSFAAGHRAKAYNLGSFVWADASIGADFASTANNQFLIRASGGVGIGTNNPNDLLHVAGQNTRIRVESTDASYVGFISKNSQAEWFTGIDPGANHGWEIYQNSAPGGSRLVVATNGNVGIGTTTPTHGTLEIGGSSGSLGFPTGSAIGRASEAGKAWADLLAGSTATAIYANGYVASSSGFIAVSDQRIKHILGRSDSAHDLSTLRNIEVTDYTYIDTVAKGNRPNKKVIAQQVEKVFPQAVNQSTNEVPDIYQPASVNDGWVQLSTDLKVGERVKLIAGRDQGIYPVLAVRDGAFRTDFKPATDKVFVYGREVTDFRSVDYDAIAMLNVSATQELARKLEAQQAVLTRVQNQLNQTLAEKEALLKHLAAIEARDQEREDRLARLESSLDKNANQAAYASVHQP
jgi:hypothetical protein